MNQKHFYIFKTSPLFFLACITGILLFYNSNLSAQETAFKTKKMGTITLPENWTIAENDTRIDAFSTDSTSQAQFYKFKKKNHPDLQKILLKAAEDVNIPVYARTMDKDVRKEINVLSGYYAHGTVELKDNLLINHSNDRVVRYYIIAIYETEKNYYKLITWTDNLPEGARELSIIQRQWYVNP